MQFDRGSYGRVLENLHDGLYVVDKERIIRYWNKAAERISGFRAAEVLGTSCADSILTHVDGSGRSLCRGMCPLAMTMADGKDREAEVYLHHKAGHRVPVSVRTSPLTDEDGRVIGGIELFADLSNQRASEQRIKELEEMALLDHLTRLANRRGMEKEMLVRFEEQKRFGVPFGVLFMDIDHFKQFNDTYGHDVGDRVLQFVSETLVKNARPFDVIGRWGGEEFLGIIRNVRLRQLENIGNRLRVLVEHSYLRIAQEDLHVTLSMGGTLTRSDESLETLLKRADTLLYQSKRGGRNRLTVG